MVSAHLIWKHLLLKMDHLHRKDLWQPPPIEYKHGHVHRKSTIFSWNINPKCLVVQPAMLVDPEILGNTACGPAEKTKKQQQQTVKRHMAYSLSATKFSCTERSPICEGFLSRENSKRKFFEGKKRCDCYKMGPLKTKCLRTPKPWNEGF